MLRTCGHTGLQAAAASSLPGPPPAPPPPASVPGAHRGVGQRPAAEVHVLCSAQREEPAQHVVPLHPELPGQTQGSPHPAAQQSREAQESQA